MELDRQSIEKRDFPLGRRGYEPEAVDAHLAHVADEYEALRRAQRQRPGADSLASAASAQVQAIVEAAESTAADIERQADMESRRTRQEAERAAERTRDEAVARAESHVEAVSRATQLMLQRVEAMEGELEALVESLRTGAGRLTADLSLLQANMGELYEAAGRRTSPPAPPASASRAPAAEPQAPPAGTEADEEPPPAESPAGGEDAEGARLVALNMALNGQSREEVDRYLSESFAIEDREALLDEVFSAVEG